MINWKVVFWSGIGGFLLSFFVGIIGGILFGTLLVRALLWGLLFSFLGGGLYYLISRYLPEMLSGSGSKSADAGNIDITLPEENPHLATGDEEPLETFEGDGTEEASGGIPLAEEVEESPLRAAGPSDSRPGDGEEAEEEEDSLYSPVEEDAPSDELPELDGDIFEGGQPLPDRPPARRTTADSSGALGGADPAEIARAIRTALRKDQKG